MNDDEDGLDEALDRFEKALLRFPAVQTVAKNEFHGGSLAIGIAAACVLVTIIGFIVMSIEFSRQDGAIRDLTAWKDLHTRDISDLQHQVSQLEKQK